MQSEKPPRVSPQPLADVPAELRRLIVRPFATMGSLKEWNDRLGGFLVKGFRTLQVIFRAPVYKVPGAVFRPTKLATEWRAVG